MSSHRVERLSRVVKSHTCTHWGPIIYYAIQELQLSRKSSPCLLTMVMMIFAFFSSRFVERLEHVATIFLSSDAFETQALSALLLARVLRSNSGGSFDLGEQLLHAIKRVLSSLPKKVKQQ